MIEMKKFLVALLALFCSGSFADAQITVHPLALPAFVQADPSMAVPSFALDNAGETVVTGTCGFLLAPGGSPLTGDSGAPITIPANSTATLCPTDTFAPLVNGPVIPYFTDGTNWYEACASGVASLNCAPAQRQGVTFGDIWISVGQSNDYNFWAITSPTDEAPLPPTAMMVATLNATSGYPQPGTAWQAPTGAAAVFLNGLYYATGRPQALIIGAIGGAPITMVAANYRNSFVPPPPAPQIHLGGCYGETTAPSTQSPYGCVVDAWNNPATVAGHAFLWPSLVAMINAAGNDFAGIIMGPGESNVIEPSSDTQSGLQAVYDNICALRTSRKPCMAFLVMIGSNHVWDAYGGNQNNTLSGQTAFAAANPLVFVGAQTMDLPQGSDLIHLTEGGQIIKAIRLEAVIRQHYYGFK
jgi:hypothetical protein